MAQEVGQQININPLDLNKNIAVGVVFPFNGNNRKKKKPLRS